MNVIMRRSILFYIDKYPKAKIALLTWYAELSGIKLKNFNELKEIYGNVSIVKNNRVVFNIKGNDFRLVVKFNFKQSALYIIWFGTHKEYDKIDVEIVAFDSKIAENKII